MDNDQSNGFYEYLQSRGMDTKQLEVDKQVRKPVGGTRRLTVGKDATMSELLNIAKQLFFVDGNSAKGSLIEFEVSLSDFSGNCYAPELTVSDLSEKLFLTDLRVYLSTNCLLKDNKRKRKKCSKKSSAASVASAKNVDSDDDFLPELNLRSSPIVTTSLTSNATVAMESAKDEVESSACEASWLPTNTPTISFRSNRCTSSLPLSFSENAQTEYQPSNEEIVLSETEMIQKAIDASLFDISASRIVSLQDILSPLSAIGTEQQSIIVQRRFFLSSVLRAVQKGSFDFRKPLYVIFSGEEAEDHGGPRREYFKLLTRAIVDDMGIFEGTTSEKGFTYNLEFLRDGRYMLAGRFVWWSLSQGGPGIPALNSAVYAFMLGQPMVLNEALSAIGEPMRKNLDLIAAADSQTDFDEVMSSLSDWLLEMGIFRLKRNATERFVIISDLLKHFLFYRVKFGLEQFQKGLGPVWRLAVEQSELMKPLFVHSDVKLTAEVVRSLYTIKWSENGDNNSSLEDDTLYAWDCFLQEAECQDSEVTLSQILDFWTGADAVPPLRFEKKLTIDFYVLVPKQRLPTSSTCSMTLYSPRGVSDVDRLTSMLRMAVQESRGFGFI